MWPKRLPYSCVSCNAPPLRPRDDCDPPMQCECATRLRVCDTAAIAPPLRRKGSETPKAKGLGGRMDRSMGDEDRDDAIPTTLLMAMLAATSMLMMPPDDIY